MSTATRTNPAVVAGFNRGNITSVFVPAPSCTETLTLSTASNKNQLYFAHGGIPYFDPQCIPMGTKEGTELTSNRQWESYYCALYIPLSFFTMYLQPRSNLMDENR
jgi:hypothetical protein